MKQRLGSVPLGARGGIAARVLALGPAFALGLATAAAAAGSDEMPPRDALPEAIFTQRAFLERNLEVASDVDFDEGGGNEVDLSLAGSWTYGDRLQVGVEVPYSIVSSPDEPDESGFSDIGISTQVVLCCPHAERTAFVSARFEVEAPTGSRSKGIGGNGSFAFSLLGDLGVDVAPRWGPLSVQIELTYEQEMKRSRFVVGDDETGNAATRRVHEKEIQWNVALVQPVLGRRLVPVLELLGTTSVDAADRSDEVTSAQVGVGLWSAPFDDGALRSLELGAGYRFPISGRRTDDGGLLGLVKWRFD